MEKLNEVEVQTILKSVKDKYPEHEDKLIEIYYDLSSDEHRREFYVTEEFCRKHMINATEDNKKAIQTFILELIEQVEKNMNREAELFCDNFKALRKIEKTLGIPKSREIVICPYCGNKHKDN